MTKTSNPGSPVPLSVMTFLADLFNDDVFKFIKHLMKDWSSAKEPNTLLKQTAKFIATTYSKEELVYIADNLPTFCNV